MTDVVWISLYVFSFIVLYKIIRAVLLGRGRARTEGASNIGEEPSKCLDLPSRQEASPTRAHGPRPSGLRRCQTLPDLHQDFHLEPPVTTVPQGPTRREASPTGPCGPQLSGGGLRRFKALEDLSERQQDCHLQPPSLSPVEIVLQGPTRRETTQPILPAPPRKGILKHKSKRAPGMLRRFLSCCCCCCCSSSKSKLKKSVHFNDEVFIKNTYF